MRINELLTLRGIKLNASVTSEEDAVEQMINLLDAEGCISDKGAFRKGIFARENLSTTAVGEGIAIPHAKVDAVLKPGIAAMTVPNGVDYSAPDKQPVTLLFMIAAPASGYGNNIHLKALQHLAILLAEPGFKTELLKADGPEKFLQLITEEEAKKFAAKQTQEDNASGRKMPSGKAQILAVTACPTGIAHTFMAAEKLTQQAQKMGVAIKVETDGAGGVENALTPEDIASCDGIIVAVDREVEMNRFNGRPVIKTSVTAGINKPQELIQQILDGKAPTFHSASKEMEVQHVSGKKNNTGSNIYKQLMNGVSHMLPFVIGGGILIAIAFLIDSASGVTGGPNFGSTTLAAKFFKCVGGFAFNMMLPVLAGFIAMAIADRPGLAVGFVGGILAMNGSTFSDPAGGKVSAGFLGALFAGFIAGYLILGLKKLCSHFPKSLEGIKSILIYPLAGIFLIGIVMSLINPLMIWINVGLTGLLSSMNTNAAVVCGLIIGGMMATDMGGPINKAAYLFATASLSSPGANGMGFKIMASCMIGGMVPPLAIALCTTLFKNRFTPKERQSGLVNYVMGLSFITEGAIPFAAADPLRVLPSMIAGSAVSGALSMAFGCQLHAPHGGIFVLPTITNPFGYFIALVAGMFVGCFILALLKKPLPKEVYDAKLEEGAIDNII